ncbi:MAG: hypothetical protein ACP5QK_08405, partial [Myxococcota bacterium]
FYMRLMEMESRITGIEYSDATSIIDEHYRGFDRFIEMKIEKGRIKGIKRNTGKNIMKAKVITLFRFSISGFMRMREKRIERIIIPIPTIFSIGSISKEKNIIKEYTTLVTGKVFRI